MFFLFFKRLHPRSYSLGAAVRKIWAKSRLDPKTLAKIWYAFFFFFSNPTWMVYATVHCLGQEWYPARSQLIASFQFEKKLV